MEGQATQIKVEEAGDDIGSLAACRTRVLRLIAESDFWRFEGLPDVGGLSSKGFRGRISAFSGRQSAEPAHLSLVRPGRGRTSA